MNGTKRPRAMVAPLLGGLAALALALLAPRAAASVPRAGEMVAPVERISAPALESSLDLSALERALIPDADVTEAPLFTLGDVVLDDTEREQRFGLGPMQLVDVEAVRGPPASYPETRIRAFAFLGSTLIGVSHGVSLDLLPGYERIGLGLAEGDVVNLYAYVGLQPHAAIDPMGQSLMGDILHIGARAAPKVATAVAAGFLLSAAGPFGVVIGAGMAVNGLIAIYGEVGGSDDPVAELLDLGQDVTGIRSAMEGMTGKEAGTGRALSREERLDAIGDAIGDGAAALAGKAGARLGTGARRMAAAGRGRTGRREASATGRRAGAESREGHARGGTRDHGAQATSRPTHSANEAMDGAAQAARRVVGEGELVHNSAPSRWSKVRTPWQRDTFRRADIDWALVRPKGSQLAGKTNLEAAEAGWAPVRLSSSSKRGFEDVVLHHLNQDPRGGVAELWRPTHGSVPHGMGPAANWRKSNPAWAAAWRREQAAYWRWRAGVYKPPATDRLWLPGDR